MASLRAELQAIYNEHGRLTPAILVNEARSEDHPLHSRLEWDNEIAGEKYRLVQAGELIRSVKVKYAETKDGDKSVREWVSVTGRESDPEASYMPTGEAVSDELTRQIILRDMEREWKAFKRRYEHMREFAELIRKESSAA